jgi:transposase
MENPEIFSATLGLSHPWHITLVNFSKDEKRLDITIDFAHADTVVCPRCGAEMKCCRAEDEVWFHDNFFRFATYLHARVPQIECDCGINPVERPWSREGSRFALIS